MNTKNSLTNTTERRNKIIDLLNQEKTASVNALSKLLGVSAVTIRNDFRQLESKGCIIRTHGGAILNTAFAFDLPLAEKHRINLYIKTQIAKRAAELVNDGDHIIIDSGSTASAMIPYLKGKKNLTVFTNSIHIAYDLSTNTDIEVIIAGGNVRKNAYSISGPGVQYLLEHYHFNKLFLGVDGFDINAGITTPNLAEATVNKAMCKVTDEIIVITDSSKFGRNSFYLITKIEKIHRVITDNNISDVYKTKLKTLNIDLIIANSSNKK